MAMVHASFLQKLLVVSANAKQSGRLRSMASASSFEFPYTPERTPPSRPPDPFATTMLMIAIAATEELCTNKIQRSLFIERTAAKMTMINGNTLEKSRVTLKAPPLQTGENGMVSQS